MVRSEETDRLAHRALDVQGLDILPVLLEQGDQEVDTKHDITQDLILSHLDMANGDTQAKNLLELELDGRADLSELAVQVFVVGDGGGELSSLRETGSKETGNLLDQDFGSQESIVLLSELLDELLVLVQFFEIINGHVLKLNLLGTIDVGSVTEQADGHARTGNVGQLDSSRETLVTLGIVVLEANLEFDGLDEVALLVAVGFSKKLLNGAPHA